MTLIMAKDKIFFRITHINLRKGSDWMLAALIFKLNTRIHIAMSSMTERMATSNTLEKKWLASLPLNSAKESKRVIEKKLIMSAFGISNKKVLPVNKRIYAPIKKAAFLPVDISFTERNPFKKVMIRMISNRDVQASTANQPRLCIILSTSQDNW